MRYRITRYMAAIVASAFFFAAHAFAQVPSFQQPPAQFPTYSAAVTFTPAVTASKDILSIVGSATKLVRVTQFNCIGVSTSIGVVPVILNKYTTAPTGGTATTVGGQPDDSLNSAATAVVKAYTAAPTSGSGGGNVRQALLQSVDTDTPASAAIPVGWDFSNRGAEQWGMVLRGTAQALVLSTSATALAAGTVLTCNIVWTEQ